MAYIIFKIQSNYICIMKNSLILIALLIFSVSGISQTIKGFYVSTALKGVGDDTELSDYAKKADVYAYTYSNKKSLLELVSKGSVKIDTITVKNEKYDITSESVRTSVKADNVIFRKDFLNNVLESYSVINKEEIYIKDKLPVYGWAIQPETKLIEGFTCKKATASIISFGSRLELTAWFCEDIPVNDGPLLYGGLPGLIFEISSKTFIISFKNIEADNSKITKIKDITTTVKPVTIKELESKWQ